MRVIAFAAAHLPALMIQSAQASPPLTAAESEELAKLGYCYTGVDEAGTVHAIAGVVPQWEGRAQAFAFIGANAGRHFLAIDRAVRRFLRDCPYRRVEAHVDVNFPAGMRWLELLGFERETERPMRKFSPDGRDCHLYARVR